MTRSDTGVLGRSRPRVSLEDYSPEEVRVHLVRELRRKGVREAYLFGSFATGNSGPWSDIDLLVVRDSDLPMVERAREFQVLADLGVPVDVLVYTPEEFAAGLEKPQGFWAEFVRTSTRLV